MQADSLLTPTVSMPASARVAFLCSRDAEQCATKLKFTAAMQLRAFRSTHTSRVADVTSVEPQHFL
jgi:hypothetical protein